MHKKLKTIILSCALVITFILTNKLYSSGELEGNSLIALRNQMRTASVDEKKLSKKKKKSRIKKKKKLNKKRRAAKSKKKKTIKKRRAAKSKKKNSVKKKNTRKSRSKTGKKASPSQKKQAQDLQPQRALRQQRLQRLHDVKQQINTRVRDLANNVRQTHVNEVQYMLASAYPDLSSLYIDKIKIEAALDGRSIPDPAQEFDNVFRNLFTLMSNAPDDDRTKQSLSLGVISLFDDNEANRESARRALTEQFSDLLNGDIEGYISKTIMLLLYGIHHDQS